MNGTPHLLLMKMPILFFSCKSKPKIVMECKKELATFIVVSSFVVVDLQSGGEGIMIISTQK